jgi:crotonobetainyl-CoA:carnitine CoA-transferase CaiB-like acyl-CoA transferase
MANRAALETVMNAVLTTKTTNDWVEVLEAAGVPCGPVYDYAQMFADPQVRHRGLVQYASDPDLGKVPHIRTPVRIGEGVLVRNVAPKSASTTARSSAASGQRSGNGAAARQGGIVTKSRMSSRLCCPRRLLANHSRYRVGCRLSADNRSFSRVRPPGRL